MAAAERGGDRQLETLGETMQRQTFSDSSRPSCRRAEHLASEAIVVTRQRGGAHAPPAPGMTAGDDRCGRGPSYTGSHENPSPRRRILPTEGEGKCAGQHSVSLSQ